MSTASDVAGGVVGVANNVVDAIQSIAGNPIAEAVVGLAFPQITSVINLINRYRGTIDAAQPIIATAVQEGIPVVEHVIEQLPSFGTVLSKIAYSIPSLRDPQQGLENLARALGGFHKMTFEEEQRWMNAMTPGNDPSQENSRLGSG